MAYFDNSHVVLVQDQDDAFGGLYRDIFKRALDLFAVALLAFPTLCILIVLSALIARDGKSPIYVQKRIGRAGREFKMIKLRSMVSNADEILSDYLAQNPAEQLEWDEKQKLINDPRITPIGRFIRKTSLDELPQIWNVLTGDMSLVGPRPIMVEQKAIYPSSAYYDLRPGITGPWQVSSRNEATFAERAKFDAQYLSDLSFMSDVRLLAQTASVVVKATGH